MAERGIQPTTVVNIVFFALLFNIVVMAIAFFIVAGIAAIQGNDGISAAFAPAGGLLTVVATAVGLLRSALVALLTNLATDRT